MKKLLLLIIISLFFNLNLLAESVLKKRQISPIKESSNKVKKVLENISIQNDILSEFKIFEKASSKVLDGATVQRYRGGGNIYKSNKKKVALIFHEKSLGAGSLLDTKGHIITNWHVIEEAENGRVAVSFEGSDIESIIKGKNFLVGQVILINKEKDLAIVKIPKIPTGIQPVNVGSSKNIDVGDKVHVIGHPKGLLWTYAQGFVSAKRNYSWKYGKSDHKAAVIQHQTPISQGNSGGALFNDQGQLVGINTFKYAEGQNLNFAVNVEEGLDILRNPKKFNYVQKKKNSKEKDQAYGCVKTEDFDKDGKIDTCYIDDNKNGKIDGYWVDENEDGVWEAFHSDKNEDGKIEIILVDTNNNNKWDQGYIDKDGDGKDDIVGYDYNEDGDWDEFKKIT
jgi:S1-C subfamily serine protease